MKVTSGVLGSHLGGGLLRTTAPVALALCVTLILLFVAGPVGAGEGDGFLIPIVLEEGRTPPKVVEPPSVRVLRQVQGSGLVIRQMSTTPTSVVLVGNSGKGDAGTLQLNRDRGQAFTTGSNSHGYKLTSVEIASNVNSAVGNWAVSIATDGGSGPGSTVTGGHLTEPTSLTTGINNSFTSANGVDLAANTTYYIFIDMSAEHTAHWKSTNDDGEDANPAAGWSIGNASYFRAVSSTTTTWTQLGNNNLKIRVNGYAKTAPAFTGATVNGTSLVITFDKNLDTTSGTAAGQFTIWAGGTSHAATGISISGNQVRLTVPAVTADQTVTVSYTKPTSNPLKGANGADVATFSNKAVTNNTAPAQTSAVIEGSNLYVYFNSPLDTGSGTAAGRFTIEVGGSSHAATGITIHPWSVTLTVPGVVKAGQFVTVSYSKPASNPLKGSNGSDVATFSNRTVTNNTPASTASGTVRAPVTIQEGGETIEIKAYSADRDTLLSYFESQCTHLRSVPSDIYDYSWFNADGNRMMARNGWRYVEVQNANGDVTHTRPMTISECTSLALYHRQAFCDKYADRQGPNRENICPTNRTW